MPALGVPATAESIEPWAAAATDVLEPFADPKTTAVTAIAEPSASRSLTRVRLTGLAPPYQKIERGVDSEHKRRHGQREAGNDLPSFPSLLRIVSTPIAKNQWRGGEREALAAEAARAFRSSLSSPGRPAG